MMERKHLTLVCGVGLLLAGLSGCDDTPNPTFAQEVKDKYAAASGDPYQSLQNVPRQYRYMRNEPGMRPTAAQQETLGLRSSLKSLLEKLGREPAMPALDAAASECGALYEKAQAFATPGAQPDVEGATGLYKQLAGCRSQAMSIEDKSDDEVAARARLLRRFASAHMVLVSVALVAQGAEQEGLALWTESEQLAGKDKPDFKINARMLGNQ
ncbi:hypothetical protein ACFPN2_32120 [Steroidobacter flavus]|uniref:Lipoprotein n=1 Tax=Steroidobacter flavus TaxID=1842136 RepID=A0ABV8T5P1_9GAMM